MPKGASIEGTLRLGLVVVASITTVTTVLLGLRHANAHARATRVAEVARVRQMAGRPPSAARPGDSHGFQGEPLDARTIELRHNGRTATVRLGYFASEGAVRDAVAAAIGVTPDSPVALVDADGITVSMAASAVTDGAVYTVRSRRDQGQGRHAAQDSHAALSDGVRPNRSAPCRCVDEVFDLRAQIAVLKRRLDVKRQRADGGVTLTAKPSALSRVVLASLGTGRYRGIAIAALESAAKHFGGDCEVSLHLLSDDIAGVDPLYNPSVAPYREWPESGLSKFEDILHALRPQIEAADFFYFMDGDVRFKEDVMLADVAGDLVGVEHPFYPRNILGFCRPEAPPRDRGFCGYPYDRNPKSQIQIPDDQGRSFLKVTDKQRGDYWVVRSNAWYLQSAFWGGKRGPILALLDDLKHRVDVDRSHGIYSQVVQDERYVNFYFWKHTNDTDLNIRILPPSYLYPYNAHGFGDWITNHSRPIIVHGTAKPGKMIKGEAEFKVRGTSQCLDLGAAPGKDQIGVYGCHSVAHRGGSQGFIWLDGRMRVAYGKSDKPGDKTCVDGTDVNVGEPLVSRKCADKAVGQQWRYDAVTGHLVNLKSNLCVDTMKLDARVYPDAAKQRFVSVQPCGKSAKQALDVTFVSLEESIKAAEGQRKAAAAR
mmetsp:Transcript_6635/g.17074  ORF Transcript_6635/g.17074 Transcript_6635/m.17074 type:complete len:653 (-) Transcript_6635:296-2254(-)